MMRDERQMNPNFVIAALWQLRGQFRVFENSLTTVCYAHKSRL